jgi:nicotinamide-nucleotide amidase
LKNDSMRIQSTYQGGIMAEGLRVVAGSLITIGDEILFGDIPNGNAHHIAVELRSKGFRLERMITVGDEEDEIVKTLLRAHQESRFLIITGGLGPTDDDRTNDAVSRAFRRRLLPDQGYTQWLKERLAQRGRSWTDQLAKMAQLPEGAVKLGVGMAGYFLEYENVPCYFLPGVPHEMKTLLAELVIPDLEKRFPHRLVSIKQILRIQGFYESELNRRLKTLGTETFGVEIGYLPHDAEIRLTLMATAESESEAQTRIEALEKKIIPLIGRQHVFGRNEETLETVIGEKLRHLSWRLAIAESCTGGLVSRKITAVPGASDYLDRAIVTYSNQAKEELLKVPGDLIAAHGAVSEQVALAMAQGIRSQARVDVALAITGIAGPTGGTEEKPVGTVYIACVTPKHSEIEKHLFTGNRELIQERAAQAALMLLLRSM